MVRRVSVIALTTVLLAQLHAIGRPDAQAGAEIKRLDAFVGKWRLDVEIKATATTQAMTGSGTEDCELFANMHVVCKSDAGTYRSMRVLSYLPALKQYGSYSVDSYGYALYSLGQTQGGTWTFTSEAGGFKSRLVIKVSRDNYTATADYAGADGKWVALSVTKATRVK
jgi:Protein of unknown function (DUF1579)